MAKGLLNTILLQTCELLLKSLTDGSSRIRLFAALQTNVHVIETRGLDRQLVAAAVMALLRMLTITIVDLHHAVTAPAATIDVDPLVLEATMTNAIVTHAPLLVLAAPQLTVTVLLRVATMMGTTDGLHLLVTAMIPILT
jgi:hypothetical protein